MLTNYLNQSLTRKPRSSVNAYNEPTYSSSTITGRFIYKREIIRTATGEDIASTAIIYTTTAIEEGDIIVSDSKDWTIRFVYPWIRLDGTVLGYKGVM